MPWLFCDFSALFCMLLYLYVHLSLYRCMWFNPVLVNEYAWVPWHQKRFISGAIDPILKCVTGRLMSPCVCCRVYCDTSKRREHQHLSQIQALRLYMTGQQPHLKCESSEFDMLLLYITISVRQLSFVIFSVTVSLRSPLCPTVFSLFCWMCQAGRGFISCCVVGDRQLIQEVLFDAVVTAPLESYWTRLALNKSE